MTAFPRLFSEFRLGDTRLGNRMFVSAHRTIMVRGEGNRPSTALEQEIAGWPGRVFAAGDCVAPRSAEEAEPEGLRCAVAMGE